MLKIFAAVAKALVYEAICVVIALLGFISQCSRITYTLRLLNKARLALTASITLLKHF